MAYQRLIFSSRLGANAQFGNLASNGRTMIRFSLPHSESTPNGEEVTWHNVTYWANSEREVEYLKGVLLKGATVLIEGVVKVRKSMHHEFPVEISSHYVEASFLNLLSPTKTAADRPNESEAPRRNQASAVDFGAPAPSPVATPAAPPRAPDPGYAPVNPTARESAAPMPINARGVPVLQF